MSQPAKTAVGVALALAMCQALAQWPVVDDPAKLGNAIAKDLAAAAKVRDERVEILAGERDQLLTKRQRWPKDGDAAGLARLEDDIRAVERELALVQRSPLHVTKSPAAAPARAGSAPQGAAAPAQSVPTEVGAFEGWDVFKNFGKKESK